MPMIRLFGYVLRKVWRATYDSVVVDIQAIEKIKELV